MTGSTLPQDQSLPESHTRIMATLIWDMRQVELMNLETTTKSEVSIDAEQIISQEDDDTTELDPVSARYAETIRSHIPHDAIKLKIMH